MHQDTRRATRPLPLPASLCEATRAFLSDIHLCAAVTHSNCVRVAHCYHGHARSQQTQGQDDNGGLLLDLAPAWLEDFARDLELDDLPCVDGPGVTAPCAS